MHKQKEYSQNSIRKRLMSGSLWALGGKVATAFLGIAVNFILARILSPEAFGSYFLVLSIVGMGVTLSAMGLQQTVLRLVAEYRAKQQKGLIKKILQKTFVLAVFGGSVVAIILLSGPGEWIALHLLSSELLARSLPLIGALILLTLVQTILAESFRGFSDIFQATLFGGLASAAGAAFFFCIVWIFAGTAELQTVLFGCIAGWTLSVTAGALRLRQKTRQINSLAEKNNMPLPAFWPIAWPNWLTTITFCILTQADIFILGIFCHEQDVALYGSAVKLVLLVSMPLMIVNAVVPPLITEEYFTKNIKGLETSLRHIATWSAIPALGMLLIFLLAGREILQMVYGDYYAAAYPIVLILAAGQSMNVCAGSCGITLQMTGHQKIMMWISLWCGLMMILLSSILAKYFGPCGVAWAAGISLITQNILMIIMVKKHLGIFTHVHLRSILPVLSRLYAFTSTQRLHQQK